MYFSIGFEKCIESLALVSNNISNSSLPSNYRALKEKYQNFIKVIQNNSPSLPSSIYPVVIDNVRDSEKLARLFENTINKKITCIKTWRNKVNCVKSCKERFDAVNEELKTLFNLYVNYIYVVPSSFTGGASGSNAVGIIWCNPGITWSCEDMIEYFFHEMSHQCMFIDEFRYLHSEKCEDMEGKGKKRIPASFYLGRRLHSAVVTYEVLAFRENIIGHLKNPKLHPTTPRMIAHLKDTLHFLQSKKKSALIKPRDLELIELIQEKVLLFPKNLGVLT